MSTASNIEQATQSLAYRMQNGGLTVESAVNELLAYGDPALVAFATLELVSRATDKVRAAIKLDLRERLHASDSWSGLT